MYEYTLSPAQVAQFNEDGYLIMPSFLSKEEISRMYRYATEDEVLTKNSYGLMDKDGKASKLALWFVPGKDIMGLVARSKRMVNAVNQLLEGSSEICHYHSKLMQKEPRVGGAWEWHQDYGYWYRAQFPFPGEMISAMTALTEATKENGCLQVIKGSHRMGRIEHKHEGQQMGADMAYVDQALSMLEHVYVTLKPGDTLFFHSNILHRSEANTSDKARWSFITAYNRRTNKPLLEKSTSCTTPIEIVPDEAILEWEASTLNENQDFLSVERDVNVR
jgi:phytanoyl-CoA hydroxylase